MPGNRRWAKAAQLALLLGLLGVIGWWVTGQVRAWRHFRAGVRALEADNAAAALDHLRACVRAWPSSGETRFLLARAARRSGELAESARHLEEAMRLGWVAEAIELERALLDVQTGDLAGPEKYLQACLAVEHPDSALILEILTPAYLRNFQLDRATACVNRWVELQPERALAWNSKAVLATRRQATKEAVAAYQQEILLAPDRHRSRLELARLLLDQQRPAEAVEHLDRLAEALPEDADVIAQRARLLDKQAKRDEAARLLDGLLARQPDHAAALHLRGRLALGAGRVKEAEALLRRAAKVTPFEPELLYTWMLSLKQVGTAAQVSEVEKRMERCKADLKSLKNLTDRVAQRPEDAEPRREIAAIYLRNGQENDGLRWLQSALRAGPADARTHQALADYYEGKGQRHLASLHRARARGEVPAVP